MPIDPFATDDFLEDPSPVGPKVRLSDLLAAPIYEPPIEDVTFETEPIGLGLPGERFDLKCPECQLILQLRRSKHGLFYGCPNWRNGCPGSHGAHPDGRPLGEPANAVTKKARIYAHRFFDRLWKSREGSKPRMSRAEAYQWMRSAMGLREVEAHIGKFTLQQCHKLADLVKKRFPGEKTIWDRLGDSEDG